MAVSGGGLLPSINKIFQLEYQQIFEHIIVKHKIPKALDKGIYLTSECLICMFHFLGFFERN